VKEEEIQVGDLVYWSGNPRLIGLVEKEDWFDCIVYWFEIGATQRNSKTKIKKLQ